MLIEGDTSGVCQKQLNLNPQDRNCRYGRCELIKSGTDFACHCDNVSFLQEQKNVFISLI